MSDQSFPATRPLGLLYVFSLIIAVLMAAVSVIGIVYQSSVYPTEELVQAFVPTDFGNLILGLPILLGAMWLARSGKRFGLLCWPGALLYVVYSYVTYAVGIPFGILFLPYILLIAFGIYTMIGVITSIDMAAVRDGLAGRVPARISGGVLIGLSVFVVLRQGFLMVAALIEKTPVNSLDTVLWFNDLIVQCPALLLSGVLLWRRRGIGYVAGAGLLLQYAVLSLAVIPVLLYQASVANAPVDMAGIIAVSVMALICLIPLGFFAKKTKQ